MDSTKEALHNSIQHYLHHPRSHTEINKLRKQLSSILKSSKINFESILTIIIMMSVELFGNIGKIISSQIIPIFDNSIHTMAYIRYDSIKNMYFIVINIPFMRYTYNVIRKYGTIPFIDKQYTHAMSIDTKMILVLEHEFVHIIMRYTLLSFKNNTAHGDNFMKLVRALFGHGWGDFAIAHINHYYLSHGNKQKFTQLLESITRQFNKNYSNKVYQIIHKYDKKHKTQRIKRDV